MCTMEKKTIHSVYEKTEKQNNYNNDKAYQTKFKLRYDVILCTMYCH